MKDTSLSFKKNSGKAVVGGIPGTISSMRGIHLFTGPSTWSTIFPNNIPEEGNKDVLPHKVVNSTL